MSLKLEVDSFRVVVFVFSFVLKKVVSTIVKQTWRHIMSSPALKKLSAIDIFFTVYIYVIFYWLFCLWLSFVFAFYHYWKVLLLFILLDVICNGLFVINSHSLVKKPLYICIHNYIRKDDLNIYTKTILKFSNLQPLVKVMCPLLLS